MEGIIEDDIYLSIFSYKHKIALKNYKYSLYYGVLHFQGIRQISDAI